MQHFGIGDTGHEVIVSPLVRETAVTTDSVRASLWAMTRLTVTTFLLCLTFGIGSVRAQDPQRAPTLTLSQAVADAVQANRSLRGAAASVDEARAGVALARSAWWPRIRASETWQRGNQPVFVFSSLLSSRRFAASNFAIDQLTHPDPLGAFHTQVGAEQLLYDGGMRAAGVTAARSRAEAASLTHDEQTLAVATAVTTSYGRLVVVQAQERALAAAITAGREDLARATRRRDAGMATDADVLALSVHVADLQQKAIAAQGDATILQAGINQMTGAAVTRRFVAVEPADDAADGPTALDGLLARALADRADVRRADAAVRGAEAGRQLARGAYLPQVAAQAGLDMTGTRVSERSASWIVGGELRWAFALGGAERAGVAASTAALSRTRLEAEDVRARAEVDVVTAWQHLQSARARQDVGRAAVDQARESLRIIRDRVDGGLAPVNDLLRASSALLDAETSRVSALADVVTARADLARATGQRP